MSQALYGTISIAMRYWFLLLAALTLLAIIFVSRSEYRQRRAVLDEAGQYIGYLEVLSGPPEDLGERIGIARDNTVGSSKGADIVIRDGSVARAHALIYQKEDDVILSPLSKKSTKINGRRAVKAHKIYTGDVVSFGNVDARVFLRRGTQDDD